MIISLGMILLAVMLLWVGIEICGRLTAISRALYQLVTVMEYIHGALLRYKETDDNRSDSDKG